MAVLIRPRVLVRIEGAVGLALALLLYQRHAGSWLLFVLLILVPDLSILGYLAGPRIGAAVYNAVHATLGPVVLMVAAFLFLDDKLSLSVATIWLAHIGIDRAVGYGLKYPASFSLTHLGRIGKAA